MQSDWKGVFGKTPALGKRNGGCAKMVWLHKRGLIPGERRTKKGKGRRKKGEEKEEEKEEERKKMLSNDVGAVGVLDQKCP